MQFTGSVKSASAICAWSNAGLDPSKDELWCDFTRPDDHAGAEHFLVHTREGDLEAEHGDWIIKGPTGDFWPCKPDHFAAKYEPIEEPPHVE